MKPKVYIDGQAGTTGLQIYDRLGQRDDIELLQISDALHRDVEERKKFMNAADLVFQCLPDAAAVVAVGLVENPETKKKDISTGINIFSTKFFIFSLIEIFFIKF